jgi:hypothetical protein
MKTQMFFPMAALVLVTFINVVVMFLRRVEALKNKQVRFSYFSTYSKNAEGLPEKMVQASRHYSNLFEMPVLFYAGCLVTMVLGVESTLMLALSWLYVLFRGLHMLIHLTSNNIHHRLYAFGGSVLVLLVFWVALVGKIFLNN